MGTTNEGENVSTPKQRKGVPCEKCDSTLTYFRIRDNQRVCRNCGHVQVLGPAPEPRVKQAAKKKEKKK